MGWEQSAQAAGMRCRTSSDQIGCVGRPRWAACLRGQVGDAIFAAAGEHFDEQEILELTSTRAFYSAAATITRALSIQIVPDAGRTDRVREQVGGVRRTSINQLRR